jgi:hypothetical protein
VILPSATARSAAEPFAYPLTGPALAALDSVKDYWRKDDDLVWPGLIPGRPLSDMTLNAVLKRIGFWSVRRSRVQVIVPRLGGGDDEA